MSDKVYRLGCDIGGTFTDFVLLNDETGEIKIYKCLTTPQDPSDAVEEGVVALTKKEPGFVSKLESGEFKTFIVEGMSLTRTSQPPGEEGAAGEATPIHANLDLALYVQPPTAPD